MRIQYLALATVSCVAALACAPSDTRTAAPSPHRVQGTTYTVRDTTVESAMDASGVAEPMRQATLSTRLMGTVLSVLAREGDAVAAGQPLVRIDARDLAAKQAQSSAAIADADAMRKDALTHAARIRALYADSAATRVQLDAVETAVARADAGVNAAHAAASEVAAMTAYSLVRAPFAGKVTRRFVDPGAFAAPGAPLMTVEDGSELRISASTTPDIARGIKRGQVLKATIEQTTTTARVEGVVPSTAGNLYMINALVANPTGSLLSGSSATLSIPQGRRTVLLVPSRSVTRSGDLTGVTVRTGTGDAIRWVRLGRTQDDMVEVSSGLRAGEVVVIPDTIGVSEGGR